MKRRTLLAGFGVAALAVTAGCSKSGSGGSTNAEGGG